MRRLEFIELQTAREAVDELDAIRRTQGLSQMGISHAADMPDEGQQYYRMYRSGDVRISKFLRFAKALGYELILIRRE